MRASKLAGCLVALTLALGHPASGADDVVACERALAKASGKFVSAAFKTIHGCLLLKQRGKLPASACRLTGLSTGHARTDAAMAHAEARLAKGLKRCSDARLAGMRFDAACPDPKPTGPFTRADLTRCIGNTHMAAVQALVSVQFPQQAEDCGDGVIQAEEDCDPVAVPTGCAPGETCVPAGAPDGCTCIEPGPGTCGNGVVDAGEACDPAAVPTGCAAGLDCAPAGAANECTCAPGATGQPCVGECIPPCAPDQSCVCECVTPGAECGNGVVEAGEQCDPIAVPNGCAPGLICGSPGTAQQCTCFAGDGKCGDGILDPEEECDPALPNACDPGEVCLESGALACTCGAPPANCGNGRIEWGEQCDPAADPTGCPPGQTCAVRGTPEACTCVAGGDVLCGNGVVDPGEACDPVATPTGCGPGQTCSGQCTCEGGPAACGDGVIGPGEQCDPAADPTGCPPGIPCSATCICGPGGVTTTTVPGPSPGECCGPEQIVTTSTQGTLKVSTLPDFPFPAGVVTTMDAGPPDANCRHDVIVPGGGFSVPSFCIPALGFTSDVLVTGCGGGTADGRGALWDGNAPASGAGCGDADVRKVGDTTAAPCGTLGGGCNTAPGNAGFDNRGDVDTTRGNGSCDGSGVHTQLDIPGQSITWIASDGSCPDPDGVFDPGVDTLVTQFEFILSPTTATATAAFVDKNGDGCAKAGNGPDGPVSASGTPAPGPCCVVGQATTVASVGIAFSGGAPLFDLIFSSVVPSTVTACNAFPGAGTCTIDTQGGCLD